MIQVNGKYNQAVIYTDVVDESSISQVQELCNQEFTAGQRIRLMPDIHAGAGCTIGTTMTVSDKVVPNLVGVDVGCLDMETQVLTEQGWISISSWNGEKILQYNKDTASAHFEQPKAFIKKQCSEFFHLFTKYGLDQMVSEEHKILAWIGTKGRGYVIKDFVTSDFVEKHNSLKKGISGGIKTTFSLTSSGLNMSDVDIQVIAMLSADGTIRKRFDDHTRIEIHVKKERKVKRVKSLLEAANLKYTCNKHGDGTTNFYVHGKPWYTKDLSVFWRANQHQLKILAFESLQWDGTIKNNGKFTYTTSIKQNADVIQYAFAANGIRCGLQTIEYKDKNWANIYHVYSTNNEIVRFPERPIEKEKAKDGFKYCFSTSTGYFVIRRNDKISITGNCGMAVATLQERHIKLEKLDKVIRQYVPAGFEIRDARHRFSNDVELEDLRCAKHVNLVRAAKSIGTLGGGNHFIEVDQDDDGTLYLVVHTGSRHLGVEIASYYQHLAYEQLNKSSADDVRTLVDKLKAEGKQKQIESEIKKLKNTKRTDIPKHLAYVEGQAFDDYIHDMRIAQHFASMNRHAIVDVIVKNMGFHVVDSFTTIHNYIDLDNMILRKGAVSAQEGVRLIIPINMRDGSLICIGKGNPEWNCSAPHGAGRLMSRADAKQSFTVSEFKKEMNGIFTTSVGRDTLDECPMAYKPIEAILDNIGDTVDVQKIIRPIYNFKAGGE